MGVGGGRERRRDIVGGRGCARERVGTARYNVPRAHLRSQRVHSRPGDEAHACTSTGREKEHRP
jgi:hypothetical protein